MCNGNQTNPARAASCPPLLRVGALRQLFGTLFPKAEMRLTVVRNNGKFTTPQIMGKEMIELDLCRS